MLCLGKNGYVAEQQGLLDSKILESLYRRLESLVIFLFDPHNERCQKVTVQKQCHKSSEPHAYAFENNIGCLSLS